MSAFGDDLGDGADDMFDAPSSSLNDVKLNGDSDDDLADGAFCVLPAALTRRRRGARVQKWARLARLWLAVGRTSC